MTYVISDTLHKCLYHQITIKLNTCSSLFQVLSKSVKIAFALSPSLKDETQSTQHFIEMMDRFFDCLNVRRLGQDVETKKPELAPYRNANDWRFEVTISFSVQTMTLFSTFHITYCPSCLPSSTTYIMATIFLFPQWLKEEFLTFLEEWEKQSMARVQLNKKDRMRSCLSSETLEGLRITGTYIINTFQLE